MSVAIGPDASAAPVVVLCIGNADRGDDGVGPAVARRLAGRLPDTAELVVLDGEATRIVEVLEGAAAAVVVDACASGAAPGALRRFDAAAGALPSPRFATSSHGLGLAEAIELARTLGRLPARCVVYAIEGGCFETGAPLSPPVEAAVEGLAGRVLAELV